MSRSPSRRPAAACRILLALACLLVATAGFASPATAADRGWIRGGHLAVGVGSADLWLTPYAGGDPVVIRGVEYREVTDYAAVPAGRYTVAVRPAGAPRTSPPMISAQATVRPGTATSVFAIGTPDTIRGRVFTDDLDAPPPGDARVRVVSAAPGSQAVSVSLHGGTDLASDVALGTASDYATVRAATYTAQVSPARGAEQTRSLAFDGGNVYTVLVLPASARGPVTTQTLRDAAGSGRMPLAGVDTGAGGLATDSASSLAPLAPLAVGLAVGSATFAGLVLLRRRTAAAR